MNLLNRLGGVLVIWVLRVREGKRGASAMTRRQQIVWSMWLPVAMMAMSTLMLIAAIIAFIVRAPGAGDALLALMAVVGVVALAGCIASRNRAHALADAQNHDPLP